MVVVPRQAYNALVLQKKDEGFLLCKMYSCEKGDEMDNDGDDNDREEGTSRLSG
jgi:hypothetical protein